MNRYVANALTTVYYQSMQLILADTEQMLFPGNYFYSMIHDVANYHSVERHEEIKGLNLGYEIIPSVLGNTTCAPRNQDEAKHHKYRPARQYVEVRFIDACVYTACSW